MTFLIGKYRIKQFVHFFFSKWCNKINKTFVKQSYSASLARPECRVI